MQERLEFSDAELDAMRRWAAAETTACDGSTPEQQDAFLTGLFTSGDFWQARLERYFPMQADLIRWVFDANTWAQAEATAKRGDAS